MRHPYFHKAVTICYEHLIPVGEMPNYFINLTVDPETIDVNIHPTKTEIKFENEQPIWQILSASVKEALGNSVRLPLSISIWKMHRKFQHRSRAHMFFPLRFMWIRRITLFEQEVAVLL